MQSNIKGCNGHMGYRSTKGEQRGEREAWGTQDGYIGGKGGTGGTKDVQGDKGGVRGTMRHIGHKGVQGA